MTINDVCPGDRVSLDWARLHKACVLPESWCAGKVDVVAVREFFVELKPKLPAIVPDRTGKARFAYTFGLTPGLFEVFCTKIHKQNDA